MCSCWRRGSFETRFGAQSYPITNIAYDLAGHMTSMTYPSDRTVTNTYDNAGRLSSFSGDLGGTARTYSSGISYSSFGGMTQEQFGMQTSLYHKRHYNVRGQLHDIRVSTVAWQTDQWDWNRGAIINYYATADLSCPTNDCRANSGPDNNGNVRMQQHWVPLNEATTNWAYTQQSYGYDSLNRLSSVSELHGWPGGHSGTDYVQAYAYDRWGNRTINEERLGARASTTNNSRSMRTTIVSLCLQDNQGR